MGLKNIVRIAAFCLASVGAGCMSPVESNRPPAVTDCRPEQDARYESTDSIRLDMAAEDPNDDHLTQEISVDGVAYQPGDSIDASELGSGVHTVTCTASDGQLSDTVENTFYLGNPPQFLPFPGSGALYTINTWYLGLLLGIETNCVHPDSQPTLYEVISSTLPVSLLTYEGGIVSAEDLSLPGPYTITLRCIEDLDNDAVPDPEGLYSDLVIEDTVDIYGAAWWTFSGENTILIHITNDLADYLFDGIAGYPGPIADDTCDAADPLCPPERHQGHAEGRYTTTAPIEIDQVMTRFTNRSAEQDHILATRNATWLTTKIELETIAAEGTANETYISLGYLGR